MNGVILVFLGGGLGSIARYGLALMLPESTPGFPWRTFLANIVSCLILGLLIGLQMESGLTDSKKLLLMTGFCGGFSTFSAFSSEVYALFIEHQFFIASLYIFSSLLISIAMLLLGIRIVFP